MSPYFKLAMSVLICAAIVLFFASCATRVHSGPVAKLPPCYIMGERGIWFSGDGGRSYRCISKFALEEWRKRNGL